MIILPPVFNAGDTIYCFFNSYAGSTGASATITGLAVTDIEVYKNGSVTQRASDNGYALLDTDGIDFDGSVGLNGFSIDTSDNSDSGFWADGSQYLIHVDAITVDSQTVRFSYLLPLGYLLRPTTAGRKLDVSSGGEAGIDWANIGSPTTTVNLSGTTVKTATDVETDTADIQSRLPASLVSGRMDASVGAYQTGLTPLQPTTAGRTLDVTAGGTAGVDWGNVENPSTTVNLGGTTIDGVALVDEVTQVNGFAADSITSTALAASAVTEIQSGLATAAALATAQADLDIITGANGVIIAAGNQTFNMIGNITGNLSGSVGSMATGGITRASFAADTGLQTIRSNTAQAGATGTITLDASASSDDEFYENAIIYLTGGTGAGQYGIIVDYNGGTKVATVHQNWKTTPDNTTTFAILAHGMADAHLIDGRGLTASSAITVGAYIGGTGAAALEATAQSILGKFTGITLLAQWLGAMAGKQTSNATALTEINATGEGSGTYTGSSHSLQKIIETGSTGPWTSGGGGGGGTGANSVNPTVDDGTDPLEGAKVRFTKGAESYIQTMEADGQPPSPFGLDNGTWDVVVTMPGYDAVVTTLVVDGTETPTYSLDLVSIPPASDPAQTTGYFTVRNSALVGQSGVTVYFRMTNDPGGTGDMFSREWFTATSGALGATTVTLVKGAEYEIKVAGERHCALITIPAGAGSTYELPDCVSDR